MEESNNSAAQAIDLFVKVETIKKQNSTKQKQITSQQEVARESIINHMTQTNQPFLTVAEGLYLILKKKSSKPSLNEEFIAALYQQFQKSKQRAIPPNEHEEFSAFCSMHQQRLATNSVDLAISKSKPVSSMF